MTCTKCDMSTANLHITGKIALTKKITTIALTKKIPRILLTTPKTTKTPKTLLNTLKTNSTLF